MLRLLRGRVGDDLTLVGVGGITTLDDARARLDAGATLVQGYTAFIYEGPLWPRRIVRGLASSGRPDERGPPHDPRDPLHVTGEVLSVKRIGAFRHLTLVAPGIADRYRPGTFVAVSVGHTQPRGHLARRSFWIHRVRPTGSHGATLELVVEPVGTGTRWLAGLTQGAPVEVTGPLGPPFALPKDPVTCLLVGEGYAAAPLFPLAERLRERDCVVTMLLAAPDEAHLFGALDARRTARSVTVVTGDGSVGTKGTRRRGHRRRGRPGRRRGRLRRRVDREPARRRGGRRATRRLEPDRARADQPCGTGLCLGCACRSSARPAVAGWSAPASTARCSAATGSAGPRWRPSERRPAPDSWA